MSPLLQHALQSKQKRRNRLMALPYPEKVRIVEKLRAASAQMKAAASRHAFLREEPPRYAKKR